MGSHLSLTQRHKNWGFGLLLLGLAVGLLLLPRQLSVAVLGLLLAGGIVIGGYQSLRFGWRWSRQHIRLSAGQRQRLTRVLWSVAVGVALLATVSMQPEAHHSEVTTGLRLWLVIGVVLMLALRCWPGTLPDYFRRADVQRYAVTAAKIRWWLVAVSILALGLLTEANTQLFGSTLTLSIHVQFGLLLTGCVTLAAGLGAWGLKRGGDEHSLGFRWTLVALTLLAFALNTTGIEDYVHIWIDEFHFTDMILRLWDDPTYPLLAFNPGVAAFTSIFAYLQTLSVSIFGTELTALRMVSAFFGAATIPAVYLLGRELFDRKTALLAALLLATFPPQIHFSRLGINNSVDPLVGLLMLAFLVRGLKYGRRGDYAIAGIMLGLTQYFYEGGRLLYPALLIGWVGCIALLWRPRDHWRGFVVLAFSALLVALPVLIASQTSRMGFAPRLRYFGVVDVYMNPLAEGGLGYFLNFHYRAPLLHFVHLPDTSKFFYGGETALILGHLIPFFLIGVWVALLRLRVTGLLLVLWLVGTIIGNSLIGQWIFTARYVVAFPAVVLLIAVGIRHVLLLLNPWQGLVQAPTVWRRRVALLAGVVICLLLALPQIPYYFGPHLAVYNRQVRPFHDHIDMMYRTRNFPDDTRVFAVRTPENDVFVDHFRVLEAFWGLPPRMQVFLSGEQTSQMIANLSRETDIALFVEAEDYETLYAIYNHYGTVSPQYSPYNVPRENQFLLFYLIAPGHTASAPVRGLPGG